MPDVTGSKKRLQATGALMFPQTRFMPAITTKSHTTIKNTLVGGARQFPKLITAVQNKYIDIQGNDNIYTDDIRGLQKFKITTNIVSLRLNFVVLKFRQACITRRGTKVW